MSVTIATIVKNEAGNWLPKALECWKAVGTRILAVDNGSTDGTVGLLEAAGAQIHPFERPMDGQEAHARAFLWETAVDATPDGDWIVHLDADQCLAGDPRPFLEHLPVNRALFPVFDMWTPTAYRSDAWWRVRPWWQAVRMTPAARKTELWQWPDRGWHSGHVPLNAGKVFGPSRDVPWDCGILHYGYATHEFRVKHSEAYQRRAHVLTPQEQFHAGTILDERPRLVALPFEPTWRLL
jgi:glycosyltransferase involved in cell wall biosynthesis